MKKCIKSSYNIPFELYKVTDPEWGYKVLSLIYAKGDGYEIWAEQGFKSEELDRLSDDGYSVEFSVLESKEVVAAWNLEVAARDLDSYQITADDLRKKVKDCFF